MSMSVLVTIDSAVMLLPAILLFFVTETRSINTTASYADLPKCCKVGSAFVKQSDGFFCSKSDGRVVMQTDFEVDLNSTEEYECIEAVDSDLFLFTRTPNRTAIVENISVKMLPKCCPNNYLYDTVTHSCVENFGNSYFNATFLKVGLSNCKIIHDYHLEDMDGIRVEGEDTLIPKWNERIQRDKFCIDKTMNDSFVIRTCENYEICESVLCLHKCCPDGQSFVNGSHCKDTYVHGMDLKRFSNFVPNISAEFAIVHGYKTKVYIPKIKNYRLDDQGNFYSFQEKISNEIYSPEEETYCIEHATKNGILYGHTLFRIMEPQMEYMEKKFLYNRWAMVVSNIFLVITVLYYIVKRETRKVFGKTLVSFCSALFALFVVLIYCTFKPNLNAMKTQTTCKTIGFLIIYISLSCFVWLQVMCYDIYWTFGSSKRYASFNNKKRRDLKRFICYSLYGWGVPLATTLMLLIFHLADVLPPSIRIRIGETKCLIERGQDNYAEILFYIIPLNVIQFINVVFFVKTVRYCLQVKGNIQKMNQSADIQKKKNKFRARKERFGLVVKLSFIMGVFFLFEVVSSFYDFKKNVVTEHVEIIWDFINCLQGFFIFVIFICKIKFLKKCNRKVAIEKIRKISLTTSTRTTGISSERKSSLWNKRKYSREEPKNKFG